MCTINFVLLSSVRMNQLFIQLCVTIILTNPSGITSKYFTYIDRRELPGQEYQQLVLKTKKLQNQVHVDSWQYWGYWKD